MSTILNYGHFNQIHDIDLEEVLLRRKLNKSWVQISSELNCSRWALSRWRENSNYDETYERNVSDAELDEIISKFKVDNFNRGEVMTEAHIHGNLSLLGVTRLQIRNSLKRVDSLGIQYRKTKRLKRVEYNVPGPHYLWHIDGHHKLIQ